MKLGYARVSMQDQNLELQTDALTKHGCAKIFSDKISGSTKNRSGLDLSLSSLKKGDSLVVWKLDRLGRSLTHLIDIIRGLEKRGVQFMSLTENIDTSSPTGKLVFHIMGALAEFERDRIRERTMAGLKAARDQGRIGGRRKKLSGEQESMMMGLAKMGHLPRELMKTFRISKGTYYKTVKEWQYGEEQKTK